MLQRENGDKGSSEKLHGCTSSRWHSQQESQAGKLKWLSFLITWYHTLSSAPSTSREGIYEAQRQLDHVKIHNFNNSLFSHSKHLLFLLPEGCLSQGEIKARKAMSNSKPVDVFPPLQLIWKTLELCQAGSTVSSWKPHHNISRGRSYCSKHLNWLVETKNLSTLHSSCIQLIAEPM